MARSTTRRPSATGTPSPSAPAPTGPGGARRRRRTARAVALLAAAGLALAACSGADPVAEPEVPAPVTVTPSVEPSRAPAPEPVVPVVWPLTGVATAEVANRPAVAVKVENTTAARPQSGLEQADVVWETIVEFEVSRFVAVFHSQVPEEVGPIRSVRPMDPLIVAPLRGLLAYSGGQPGILAEVRSSGVQSISQDQGAPGMYRVGFRSAPHNVYGTLARWLEVADAEHSAPPAEQFVFALRPELATAAATGAPAANLAFTLSGQSRPSWAWDAASGTWLRSEGSTPATVASGARLSAVNVVAITAGHVNTPYGAQGGAPVPTYQLVGEGEATVATGGRTMPATWRKPAPDAPLQLFAADGSPVLLAPGNTWVELIPAGKGSLTIS
ncbi:hypothetical protein N866_08845 [Actinotalea ferrariae CF5-4]|uniref:DUF3048 domain-containing protein n=1 Tax=Actinotalea ferrariae CF5-4 TaxID=948458 RepID=A0A021VMM8_9CELL|nr:DUF3048 domain-containing protein [Actinotalea ferrariae]EYR62406.1 hypothetical protein N866_08845 [Actinotalea ferrariae CF5-4]